MNPGAPTGAISVNHFDSNGTWLIALEGEHDLSTAPLVETQTENVWPVASLAVVDLSDATFVDSSVVNWLRKARDLMETAGHGTLRAVVGPSETPAARLVGLLGLRGELGVYTTRHEALSDVLPSRDAIDESAVLPKAG